MKLYLDPASPASYRDFLAVKSLPIYRIRGRVAEFPDEYATRLGIAAAPASVSAYEPWPGLFDYQRGVAKLAIEKRKFALFMRCGLGKTFIILEHLRHALAQLPANRKALLVSPLMVIDQTISEAKRFYGEHLMPEAIKARDLNTWLADPHAGRLGITNYEALHDGIEPGLLGCLDLDESAMLKSMYGKFGQSCIRLGKGLEWKLAATGCAAPNDRIEYGNHALFLDQVPTLNAFLAKYFVNRGQSDNRWEMKPHAIGPFYRALSHWSIFLNDPSVYGWRDNIHAIPPVNVTIHEIDLTPEQERIVRQETDFLATGKIGGITKRAILSSLAKGRYREQEIPTNKPGYIRNLVESWPGESTIIWCRYNHEQEKLEHELPNAASIKGSTKHSDRVRMIEAFKRGEVRQLISKADILGFGLNLQACTQMIMSLQDSYEEYVQEIARANRYGSTRPLGVHIPITPIERPMIDTVLAKADRVDQDTREQERMFREQQEWRLAA